MKVRIEGLFLEGQGCFAKGNVSGDDMAFNCCDELTDRGYKVTRIRKDIYLERLEVYCDDADLKKVSRKMLINGAYKIYIEYIFG